MTIYSLISTLIFVVVLVALAAFYFYMRLVAIAGGSPSSALAPRSCQTPLDLKITSFAQANQGLGLHTNALGLIASNLQAFAGRVVASDLAGRSLDLMYYLWNDDITGRLMLYHVLQAAERGVRVRILLDDVNAQNRDPAFRALSHHNNIEVRLFNPVRATSGGFRRGIEMLLRAFRVTRRMHNKAFIVDGRVAFVGGRNVADRYFDADQTSHFRDLDLLAIGPAVADIADVFDQFWNSLLAVPIEKLTFAITTPTLDEWKRKLEEFSLSRQSSPYLIHIKNSICFEDFLRVGRNLFRPKTLRIISDPPEKALGQNASQWLIQNVERILKQTKKSLDLTSPYFVPAKFGIKLLNELTRSGVRVKILTNSLAATDVAIVHGGYIRYRKMLLKTGVELYELQPNLNEKRKVKLFRSRRTCLHTKAFLVDKKQGFIGSFNFDPRSTSLNTEMGIYFDCREIAAHMDLLFGEETTSEMSYRVDLTRRNTLSWTYTRDGNVIVDTREPETRFIDRSFAKFISWLPIVSQL